MMLCTFPKAYLQASISLGYFPKWKLLKCAISQTATSQVCPSRSARPPHCSLRRFRGPYLTFGKLPLGKLRIWEVATWEIDTWEVVLGKCLSEIYLTPKLQDAKSFKSTKWFKLIPCQPRLTDILLVISQVWIYDFNQFYPLKVHCLTSW